MKKSILAVLLCVLMASLTFVPAFAAEIASVDTSALPEISVEVNGAGNVNADAVKATLDGKKLDVSDVQSAKATSTDWIIMVDTSASNNRKEFASEKAGIKALINSLGENEKVILYTFDEKVEKVLDGSESKEAAVKKVDAINCDGQHTAFYEAASKLVDLAKASKADNVVPVIYSDGEDTSKNPDIPGTNKKVADSKAGIKGFYPSGTKAEYLKAFKALAESSGGSVAAFTAQGSGTQLKKANPQANAPAGKTTLKLNASENIDANDAAVLSIDLGDGKPITKAAKVAAWSPEPATEVETSEVPTQEQTSEVESTEAPTEETPAETTVPEITTSAPENKDTMPVSKIIGIIALVLAVLLLIFFLVAKKKDKAPEEGEEIPEELTEEAPETEEQEPPAEEQEEEPEEDEQEEPEEEPEEEVAEEEEESKPEPEPEPEPEEDPYEEEEASEEDEDELPPAPEQEPEPEPAPAPEPIKKAPKDKKKKSKNKGQFQFFFEE